MLNVIDYQDQATSEELAKAFGTHNWGICPNTATNRKRYAVCLTLKRYQKTEAAIIANRHGYFIKAWISLPNTTRG